MPAHVINVIEADIPAELTLAEWRRARAAGRSRRRLTRRTFVPARRPRPLLVTAS
jgi:hypothetical protein